MKLKREKAFILLRHLSRRSRCATYTEFRSSEAYGGQFEGVLNFFLNFLCVHVLTLPYYNISIFRVACIDVV